MAAAEVAAAPEVAAEAVGALAAAEAVAVALEAAAAEAVAACARHGRHGPAFEHPDFTLTNTMSGLCSRPAARVDLLLHGLPALQPERIRRRRGALGEIPRLRTPRSTQQIRQFMDEPKGIGRHLVSSNCDGTAQHTEEAEQRRQQNPGQSNVPFHRGIFARMPAMMPRGCHPYNW